MIGIAECLGKLYKALLFSSIYRHLESAGRDRLAGTAVEFSECYAGNYEGLRSTHTFLGILQKRYEVVMSGRLFSHVRLSAMLWTAACQFSL